MTRLRAWDWFKIAGRGTVVSVDVSETNAIHYGDEVQFTLMPNSQSQEGLISETETYRVTGIEESRCLMDHGLGSKQCVMGRGLMVRPVS